MSTIKAGNTDNTALIHSSDSTGQLVLEADSGVVNINTTGGFKLPSGTTAQRPVSPQNGYLRVNTTTNYIELYYNGTWRNITSTVSDGPTWTTGAIPNLGTVIEDVALTTPLTVSASPVDGGTLTYGLASGSSLPTGLTLNSSTGAITGTPNVNDAYNSNGFNHTFTLTATESTYNITSQKTFSILRIWRDGTTAALAATSAKAIKDLTGTTTDGSYWVKPPNCPEAFQVHCYMSIESGGWMLVLAVADNEFGPVASGGFLAGNWAGWAYNTKSQIDALNYSHTSATGTNAFTPIFAYSPFNDVMVISRRSGQTAKRLGWRHTTQISNMYSVTGGTNAQTVGNTILFGEPRNWLTTAMDVRPDTTTAALGNNRKYGFKINADTWGANNSGYAGGLTGGNNFTLGWSNSMIGYGRDNQEGSYSGGGFGTWHYGWEANRYNSLGHHYWGWGAARSSGTWSSDTSNPWYGHAVYVREL